ncbi:transglutaminase-like domain-containing protein [Rapidithrix thailandica]|uniref:Transglutaminase-like domain-containing protein n=1 Tax=Rapidithrix thailandica TaxID=413964 RepID=A0AAW9S3V0_9BACT
MVATGKREIRSGREYNRLFPSFSELEGTDKILQHGDVFDTLNLIEKIVKETLGDTRKLAGHLKGKYLETTTKNIFDFICRHIRYRKDDPGTEQLHRPLRIWKERARGVACDDYTIFISSILSNLKVPHYYRMTRYNGRDYYQHQEGSYYEDGSAVKVRNLAPESSFPIGSATRPGDWDAEVWGFPGDYLQEQLQAVKNACERLENLY